MGYPSRTVNYIYVKSTKNQNGNDGFEGSDSDKSETDGSSVNLLIIFAIVFFSVLSAIALFLYREYIKYREKYTEDIENIIDVVNNKEVPELSEKKKRNSASEKDDEMVNEIEIKVEE